MGINTTLTLSGYVAILPALRKKKKIPYLFAMLTSSKAFCLFWRREGGGEAVSLLLHCSMGHSEEPTWRMDSSSHQEGNQIVSGADGRDKVGEMGILMGLCIPSKCILRYKFDHTFLFPILSWSHSKVKSNSQSSYYFLWLLEQWQEIVEGSVIWRGPDSEFLVYSYVHVSHEKQWCFYLTVLAGLPEKLVLLTSEVNTLPECLGR